METKNGGYKTEAAYVASICKKELKAKFPSTKFSVKSQTYSGGDSLNVSYDLTRTSPKVRDVEAVVFKFQGGHFDGMNDIYEYTYKGDGPTVKYAFVSGNISNELREEVRKQVAKDYGISDQQWNDYKFMADKFHDGSAQSSLVWREIQKQFYESVN